jgi:LPS export ABC transporter protein LptC
MVGMLFLTCKNDLQEINKLTQVIELPDQTIIDSKISYSDSSILEFTVAAGRIDRYIGEQPRDEFSNEIEVVSYNRKGEFESQINARNATSYPKDKLMIARDSVTLLNFEGKKLQTELLNWNEKEGRIYTDKFVTITTATEILYGDGLEAKQDFSEYEIQNIKGRIKIEESDSNQQTQ